jgi:hypothetical protein
MATPLAVPETTDVTDAKVLAAQIPTSLQPVERTDSYWTVPSVEEDFSFNNFYHLTNNQFRKVMKKVPLNDVLSFSKTHSAGLTDEQRQIVVARMSKL